MVVKHSAAGEGELADLEKESLRMAQSFPNLETQVFGITSQETTCLDTGAGGTFSAGVAEE